MVMNPRYFLLSICLHGVLIAVFFIGMKSSDVGDQSVHIMHAYLFHASKIGINKKMHNMSKNKLSHHDIAKNGLMPTHKSMLIHSLQQTSKAKMILSVGVRSLLLEKIHDAVADKLIYPSSAAFLHLSGTTTVSFELLPSGEIKNIKVISSSQSAILDKSAISALHAITPFLPAKKYLNRTQSFTIPIEFKN